MLVLGTSSLIALLSMKPYEIDLSNCAYEYVDDVISRINSKNGVMTPSVSKFTFIIF